MTKRNVLTVDDPAKARRAGALVARTTLSREDILHETLEEDRSGIEVIPQ